MNSNTYANLGLVSGVAGAISSIFAGQTQAIGYEMQEAARKAQADQARSVAKLNNLKLQKKYNDTVAAQAVTFASQGRSFSSGSIQNILRQDKVNLEWDKRYMTMSGEYQSAGVLADAVGYGAAAKGATQAGYTKGLLKVTDTLLDYGKIK